MNLFSNKVNSFTLILICLYFSFVFFVFFRWHVLSPTCCGCFIVEFSRQVVVLSMVYFFMVIRVVQMTKLDLTKSSDHILFVKMM